MGEKEVERDELQQLTRNELFYLLNGKSPDDTSYTSSHLKGDIKDEKLGQITDRFFNLIEDLAALQYDDFCDDEYWSDIKAEIGNPVSDNPIYSEANEFLNEESIDKDAYIIGLQLGHLADLLTYSTQLNEEAEERKTQEALIKGFSLGLSGYGKSRLVKPSVGYDDRTRERLANNSPIGKTQQAIIGGSVVLNGEKLAEDGELTYLVDQLVEEAVVDGDDPMVGRAKSELKDAGIEIIPFPPVLNKVLNLGDGHPPELGSETERAKFGVECLKHEYAQNIQNVFPLAGCIQDDIEQIFKQVAGIGSDIKEYEVLYGAISSSNSKNRDIHECIKEYASGNEITEDAINSGLQQLRGVHQSKFAWQDHPLIEQGHELTAYGTLLSKIIFPMEEIRETDRYLPTPTEEADYVRPSSIDVTNACYAFALDCPSEEHIEGSWESLYEEACKERINELS
jgi:hypothetical protein